LHPGSKVCKNVVSHLSCRSQRFEFAVVLDCAKALDNPPRWLNAAQCLAQFHILLSGDKLNLDRALVTPFARLNALTDPGDQLGRSVPAVYIQIADLFTGLRSVSPVDKKEGLLVVCENQ